MPEEDYYPIKYECVYALELIQEMFQIARDSGCLHVVWDLLSAGIRGPDASSTRMSPAAGLKTTYTAPLRRVLLGPVLGSGLPAEVSPCTVREAHDRLMEAFSKLSPNDHFGYHMRVAIGRLRLAAPTKKSV